MASPAIHAIERGEGPAIALLHGFPLDARMWEHQVEALSPQYRVIALDLPGFGGSTSEQPFTIDSLAESVHTHLKQIGAMPCVLGGLSMGGYVALALCQRYPTALNGLILLDTKADADTPQQREGRAKMIELVRREGSKAVAEQMLPRLLCIKTLRDRPAVVSKLRAIMESCPPKTIEHALAAMRDRPDRSGMLASIAMPVLIVVGQEDAITPPSVSQEMHKQIARSNLLIVDDAGHMSPMEQPQPVSDAIKSFLDSCYAGVGSS